MLVLGISGGVDPAYENRYEFPVGFAHDAAAVLVEDGAVVAGIEEERINRIKHCNKLCINAIRFCLSKRNIGLNDLDYIAIYASRDWVNSFLKLYHLQKPDSVKLCEAAEFFQYLLQREFGETVPLEKFKFISHHIAHSVSAHHMSGFDESLVFTVDGVGEGISAMLSHANGKNIKTLHTEPEAQSLGSLYRETIRFLGYYMFDEYKVMGLAPYGKPEWLRERFKRFYTLSEGGRYQLHMERLLELYEVLKPRRRGEPFEQIHKDIAAALQVSLEDIVFHLLKHYKKETGLEYLCMAGGVAQNSSMNGKIITSGLFKDVFIQPASHDAGCALGSALAACYEAAPNTPLQRLQHVYWGTAIGENDTIQKTLSSWSDWIEFKKMDNTATETAQLLAEGAAIGWAQGCSEFGPRALGNRSILADPRPAKNKDTINAMIKKREGYRPFAPSVIEEQVETYFEVPSQRKDFPFMSCVLKVKPDKRDLLGAITHHDGTARLQTVSRSTNPAYWELINAFGDITGVPILLNTSFNNNAEPIVDTEQDAIVCFLTSGLNYLIIGDYQIKKKAHNLQALSKMSLKLPHSAIIEETLSYESYDECKATHQLRWNYDFGQPRKISKTMYSILCSTDAGSTVGSLIKNTSPAQGATHELLEEIFELWSERRIILNPA